MATIRCLDYSFEPVQAVLFDKDGTLANVETYLRALGSARAQSVAAHLHTSKATQLQSAVLSTFGLSPDRLDPAGLLAVGSRYENEIAAAACLAAVGCGWIAAVERVKAAFVEAETALAPKVHKTPMLAGVNDLISRLAAAGVKVGIVSSDLHSEVAAFVDYYQLAEVSWYCGASSTTLPKTHPDFLQFACEALMVDLAKTLVIGDSAADYRLASQGAAGFLGMTGGWQEPPDIDDAAKIFSALWQVTVAS